MPPSAGTAADPASQATPRRPDAPRPAFDPSRITPTSGLWGTLGEGSDPDRPTPIFDAPAPDDPQEAPRKRRVLPLAIGALAVVLALVLVYQVLVVDRRSDDAIQVSESVTASGARVTDQSELVRRYFEAIAAGDIQTALGFGPVGTGSRIALTEQAVRQSMEFNPITGISVPDVPESSLSVPVKYRFGGEEVSTSIQVRKLGDGSFTLEQSTVTVPISAKRSNKIPLLVNGEEFNANSLEVLPGTYRFTTGLPFLQYEGAELQVTSPGSRPEVSLLTVALTKEGRDALLATGRASLDDCLASRELAPAGCPFAATTSQPVVPGSVRWGLINDPWAAANPRLSSDRAVAEVVLDFELQIRLRYTNGSVQNDTSVPSKPATLRVDMSRKTREELEATWGR
jgi:hypothetical protein